LNSGIEKSILRVTGLAKSFDGVKAVDDVSFGVIRGTITTIIGPNGAGKTSLFNIIGGFLGQDAGSILLNGVCIDSIQPPARASLGLGRLWQDIRLFKNMTVLDNLMVCRKNHIGEHVVNSFLHRKRVLRTEGEIRERAMQILKTLRLDEKFRSLAQDLSYGQQKLVALGRLLMNDAEFLLLDEPTAGVNPLVIDEVLGVIRNLVTVGKTVLMIEHNIPKALGVSDWVYVMDEGRIELSGSPSDIKNNPGLREIYLGV
jgi:ABC-type branched-subunit amino acid transport system ATPase component